MRLREGVAALGVWLPLALADLARYTLAAATMGEQRVEREEMLASWCLPNLASAVRHDVEEARDDQLINGLEWIERNFSKG